MNVQHLGAEPTRALRIAIGVLRIANTRVVVRELHQGYGVGRVHRQAALRESYCVAVLTCCLIPL